MRGRARTNSCHALVLELPSSQDLCKPVPTFLLGILRQSVHALDRQIRACCCLLGELFTCSPLEQVALHLPNTHPCALSHQEIPLTPPPQ